MLLAWRSNRVSIGLNEWVSGSCQGWVCEEEWIHGYYTAFGIVSGGVEPV